MMMQKDAVMNGQSAKPSMFPPGMTQEDFLKLPPE